jgi:hypothetical protein
LSDLENLTVKWGYPRLTYDQTLKILERKWTNLNLTLKKD